MWNKDLEWVKEQPEDWKKEADPNKMDWSLKHGFFTHTSSRYRLVCWTCNYEGHKAREQDVGSLQVLLDQIVANLAMRPSCVESRERSPQGLPSTNPLLEDGTRETTKGHFSTRNKREGGLCGNEKKEKYAMLDM